MASIHKEIVIDAAPEAVWDAVADIGQIHIRLCPGFVVDTQLEPDGGARMVTFGNGAVVREVIVDNDPVQRRLAWKIESERVAHHNGSMQVFALGEGRTRAVWIADVLPHAAAETFSTMMGQGMAAMKARLET